MLEFEIMGPKEGKFEKYQTLNYIDKIIEGIEQAQVDDFNHTIGRLFKWLKLAVDNRKADIIRRRALITKARDERDAKIQMQKDRAEKRVKDLEEAEAAFLDQHKEEIDIYNEYKKKLEGGGEEYGEEEEEEEGADKNKEPPVLPVFNKEEFLAEWDKNNEEIVVEDSTENDIDNDWELTEEEYDEKVKAFWGGKNAD